MLRYWGEMKVPEMANYFPMQKIKNCCNLNRMNDRASTDLIGDSQETQPST